MQRNTWIGAANRQQIKRIYFNATRDLIDLVQAYEHEHGIKSIDMMRLVGMGKCQETPRIHDWMRAYRTGVHLGIMSVPSRDYLDWY